jgi:hypothetical protein
MNFLTYFALRFGVFLILVVLTSPVVGALIWLLDLFENHDTLRPFQFLVILLALFWLLSLGWMVQQTTNRMMFENRTLFSAIKDSLSYARLCLSFVPVVGRLFTPKVKDKGEDKPE